MGSEERLVITEQADSWRAARAAVAACRRPISGETFTVAFNNVAPFVRAGSPMVRPTPDNHQGGVEPKILGEFATRFGLQLSFFDAKFTWGSFVEETQRWDG